MWGPMYGGADWRDLLKLSLKPILIFSIWPLYLCFLLGRECWRHFRKRE